MCVLKRCEILAEAGIYIEERQLFYSAHPEVRQHFEVRHLIERIWYVPVSLVTCVMAALSLVLSAIGEYHCRDTRHGVYCLAKRLLLLFSHCH